MHQEVPTCHSAPPMQQPPPPQLVRSRTSPPPPPPAPAPPLQRATVTAPPSHPSAAPPTTFYRHAMVAAATKVPPSPMKAPRASGGKSVPGGQPPSAAAAPLAIPSGKKASLNLHGDLLAMTSGWDQDEWTCRRRLVQFWRKLEGSTIHATWAPVSQANYVESTIVISCIFRDETNECYVRLWLPSVPLPPLPCRRVW